MSSLTLSASMSKKNLIEVFPDADSYSSDVWVADYTEQARKKSVGLSKEQKSSLKTGVHIQDFEFDDIAAFHLTNNRNIEIVGVNFEKHKSFFPSGTRDCECMFRAKEVKKGWVLLCELKYCLDKPKNRDDNASSAYKQLSNTWELLKEKVRFEKQGKVYFNLSFPEHKDAFPFSSFVNSQSDQLDTKASKGVVCLGLNNLLIMTEGQIIVPQVVI